MNKQELAEVLKTKINKSIDECTFILTCIEEDTSNKDLIIDKIKEKLSITGSEANEIYETSKELLKNVLKERIKHPFKKELDKDKI